MRQLTILILLLALLTVPVFTNAQSTCNSQPFQRGDVLVVNPGQAQNVREQPTTHAPIAAGVPPGEYVTVWGGPECADGYTWWQVNYGQQVGWTAEAPSDGSAMWLSKVAMTVFEAGNVRLIAPKSLVTGLSFVDEGESGGDGFDTPPHRAFTFKDFPGTAGRWDFQETSPGVDIYPRTQEERSGDSSPQSLMQNLMAYAPAPGDLVRFSSKPETDHLNVYFYFASGIGIRVITYTPRSQGFGPIDPNFRYGFNGITSDGAYQVNLGLPINIDWTIPPFPADIPVDAEGVDYRPFQQEYDDYLTAVHQALLDLPPEAFTPRLALLDAITRSIEITGNIELQPSES